MGERRAVGLVGRSTRRWCRTAGATTTAFAPIPIRRSPAERSRIRGDRRLRRSASARTRRTAGSCRSRYALRRIGRERGRAVPPDDRRQHLRAAPHPRRRRWAAPAMKTTTGSSPTSSRIATSSIASRCIRRSAITTPMKPRSATIARRSKTTSTCASASASEEAAGRASFRPGAVLSLPLRLGHRVRLHRHVEGRFLPRRAAVRVSEALGVRRAVVSGERAASDVAHPVRASSALQRRAAASQHARHGAAAAAVRAIGRARDVHRPRAQLSALARRRPRSFRDRRRRQGAPRRRRIDSSRPRTVSWATDCHFLLAKISGDRMTVLPIGALDDPQRHAGGDRRASIADERAGQRSGRNRGRDRD